MQFPVREGQKVRVLSQEYTITLKKPEHLGLGWEGATDCHKRIIHINPTLTPAGQLAVMLHEIFHAVDYHLFLGRGFKASDRERMIEGLTAGMYSFLEDNFGFQKTITRSR